jgi:hypothetical protein
MRLKPCTAFAVIRQTEDYQWIDTDTIKPDREAALSAAKYQESQCGIIWRLANPIVKVIRLDIKKSKDQS